jgi:hypothetical protein
MDYPPARKAHAEFGGLEKDGESSYSSRGCQRAESREQSAEHSRRFELRRIVVGSEAT